MAAAWFNRLADPAQARAMSAGTNPGPNVQPPVVTVMREVGIDLLTVQPVLLTDRLAAQASHLVTMGCGEDCPVVPGAVRDDWPLEDPKGQDIARVREIRNEIYDRVRRFVLANHWERDGVAPSPLATEDQILEMITAFRNGTLVKEAFTHQAHLLVGLWHLDHFPVDDARRLVPEGIRRFNARVGTTEKPRGGYHETITQFYLTIIDRFRRDAGSGSMADRTPAMLASLGDRGLVREYFSDELLWSAPARAQWIEPDLKAMSE